MESLRQKSEETVHKHCTISNKVVLIWGKFNISEITVQVHVIAIEQVSKSMVNGWS